MAPVFTSTTSSGASSSSVSSPLVNPGLIETSSFSALTKAGESLFMCSSKEGHVCYHACRGHGRYPLWSDEEFMVDDVDEEEKKSEASDDSYVDDFNSDEEWMTDGEEHDDSEFWREIQESVERTRAERRAQSNQQSRERIYYAASDLRFLIADGDTPPDQGPVVGVITSKPPPEYVWYVADDNEAWMRGSQPEKLTEEQDGAYFRYRYHVWDRIPNEDVRGSSDDESWEDEEEEEEEVADEEAGSGSGGETRSWSELADIQEEEQQQQEDPEPSC